MSRKQLALWTGVGSLLALAVVLAAAVRLQATGSGTTDPGVREPSLLALLAAPLQQEASEAEQRGGEQKSEGSAEEEQTPFQQAVHWFNFLLIVGGIAFMVKKFLVPFLHERGNLIRADMDRSAKMLVDADERLAMVEAKMKSLDEELASLRQAAFHESIAERERIEQAAVADANKIVAAAEQEIEASIKVARQQLKQYAAELAVDVAETKIRASLTPQSEQRILQSFVKDLASDPSREMSREKKN